MMRSQVIEALTTFMITVSNAVPGITPITKYVDHLISRSDKVWTSTRIGVEPLTSRELKKVHHIIIAMSAELAVYQTFLCPTKGYWNNTLRSTDSEGPKVYKPFEYSQLLCAIPIFVQLPTGDASRHRSRLGSRGVYRVSHMLVAPLPSESPPKPEVGAESAAGRWYIYQHALESRQCDIPQTAVCL